MLSIAETLKRTCVSPNKNKENSPTLSFSSYLQCFITFTSEFHQYILRPCKNIVWSGIWIPVSNLSCLFSSHYCLSLLSDSEIRGCKSVWWDVVCVQKKMFRKREPGPHFSSLTFVFLVIWILSLLENKHGYTRARWQWFALLLWIQQLDLSWWWWLIRRDADLLWPQAAVASGGCHKGKVVSVFSFTVN